MDVKADGTTLDTFTHPYGYTRPTIACDRGAASFSGGNHPARVRVDELRLGGFGIALDDVSVVPIWGSNPSWSRLHVRDPRAGANDGEPLELVQGPAIRSRSRHPTGGRARARPPDRGAATDGVASLVRPRQDATRGYVLAGPRPYRL